MPYSGIDDPKLPEYVQDMPIDEKEQWVAVWNSAYESCQEQDSDDCEGRAFRIANAAVQERQDSYKPTNAMKTEAQRGLDWRSEYGRGGTEVGIARARDIVNGKNLPLDTVKRMYSFFSRHEVDKEAEGFRPGEEGYPSNGRIAWALWGGDPGQRWAARIVEQNKKAKEKRMTKNPIVDLWQRITKAFKPYLERRIKEVDEWDGSPSRWDDTESYCNACLINVNEQAGNTDPSDWAQENCKLPVREPGDSMDTYVRQAIFAAAGGRGITRVDKPPDVSQDDWDRALKSAANELIAAYEEMEEIAPQSVWDIADREAPEERDIGAYKLGDMAWTALHYKYENAVVHDLFHTDNGMMYILASWDGKLWKVPITLQDDRVILMEPEQVRLHHDMEDEERSITITRQADGRFRWTAVACTAILNRCGEIDATQLFDDFVQRIESGDEPYPDLDLLHIEGTDVGKADFIARDGYILITSGLLDDDDIGRAVAEGLEREPEYWGTSIKYLPISGEYVEIGGVEIPVYNRGIIRKVTVLPEQQAAALFTTIVKGGNVNEGTKKVLARLLGNDLADEMETRIDDVNQRTVDEGMIARGDSEESVVEEQDVQQCQCDEQECQREIVDEATVITDMRSRLANLEDTMPKLEETLRELLTDVLGRLSRLERSETERKAAWLAELPAYRAGGKSTKPAIYRPRNKPSEEDVAMPAAERADMILSQKQVMAKRGRK